MQEVAIQTFLSSRTARKSTKNYLGWIEAEASSGQPRQQEARRGKRMQEEAIRDKTRQQEARRGKKMQEEAIRDKTRQIEASRGKKRGKKR
jgi:hypothetical protein